MINNLGGLSNLELYSLVNDCCKWLFRSRPNILLKRLYCGTLMTSLNMNGFSITVLRLRDSHKEEILDLLDSPTNAPGWIKSHVQDLKPFEYVKILSADNQVLV